MVFYRRNYKKKPDAKQLAAFNLVNAYAYGGFKGKPVHMPQNQEQNELLKAAIRSNLSVLHGKLKGKARYANKLKWRRTYNNRINGGQARIQGQPGIVNVH